MLKTKVSKDDVAQLIKGKPTKNRVGSRNVPIRLTKSEKEKLAVAQRKGFLVYDQKTRDALRNAWYLLCQATGAEHKIREK